MISFGQINNDADALKLCALLQSNSFSSDAGAEDAVNKILSVIGTSEKPVLQACSNINNAVAVAYKGQRYILYDREFMTSLSKGVNKYWTNMFILAHEIGHHINGHSLDLLLYTNEVVNPKSLEDKRKQELQADEFAGFVLGKLGSTINQMERILSNIPPISDEKYSTHPSTSKRILAVRKGFNKTIDEKKEAVVNKPKTLSKPSESISNLKTPDFINPRKAFKQYNYGPWERLINWDLERFTSYKDTKDPFEFENLKKTHPIVVVRSLIGGKCLNPKGSDNLYLQITQKLYTYENEYTKTKKIVEITLMNFEESPRYIYTKKDDSGRTNYYDDSKYVKEFYESKQILYNNKYDTYEILNFNENDFFVFKVGNKTFKISETQVKKFKKLYPNYIFIEKINYKTKPTDYNARGIFDYIIDNDYKGKLHTTFSGYFFRNHRQDDRLQLENLFDPNVRDAYLSNSMYIDEKTNLSDDNFIDQLRKGKKLYLRFDKLTYGDSVEDSSSTDNSFDIESYTYEFDLSGSSNALKF